MVNIDCLYNPKAAKPHFEQNYFSDKKLGFQVIEHGTILPFKMTIPTEKNRWGAGGIIDSKGESIPNSFAVIGHGEGYTPPPESIQHSSETVVYLGMLHYVWGHIITDNISRAWFLSSEYFKREFKDCPIVCVLRNKNTHDFPPNYLRILEILGIDIGRIQPITQPTQFEKIILPDRSFSAEMVTNEYRETIDILRNFALKNRTPIPNNKLYFFYGRRQVGEERVAEYFKSKGYDIISPEKLTFDEQLNVFINCESFASPLGSIAHNSIFLRDGTETIFIPRVATGFTAYQRLIDEVNHLNVNYVDSALSVFVISYCFIISEQLKRFFGDKFDGYTEEDFKVFLDYYSKFHKEKFYKLDKSSMKKYGLVFKDFIEQLKRHEDLIIAYNMPSDWYKFRSPLIYQAHVTGTGWRDGWKSNNQPSNPIDKKCFIQAIKIDYPDHKIYYSVYYNEEEGWSEEVSNGEQAGTTGKAKPIYGIKIRLDDASSKEFDVVYRVHKFDGEWTDWAKNGEELLSHGIQLNAIQIKLEPVKAQIDEIEQKKSDSTLTSQPDDASQKKFDATWTLEVKNDDLLYLQGQRQNLNQIKL